MAATREDIRTILRQLFVRNMTAENADQAAERFLDLYFMDDAIDMSDAQVTVNTLTSDLAITSTGGDITATAGDLISTLGGLTLTDGDALLTSGDLTLTAGNALITAGNATLTAGDLTLTAGELAMTDGNATLTSGDLTLTAGEFTMTDGNAVLTSGDLTLTAGNAVLTLGDLTLTDGDATLSSGNVAVTGTLTATSMSGTSAVIENAAEGRTGNLSILTARELHTLAAAGTSDTTTISIPSGAMVLGAAFNVDTAVSDDGGDDTWSAAFVTGDASTLATAGAAAKDTKVETLVAPAITTDVTQIQFTAQGGSFDAGVIDVVAYYIDLTALASAPA